MTSAVFILLFILGLAIGSFLNVAALRYDGERNVFSTKSIGGRSHCPHCKRTLRWFELLPVLSYLVQRGRCMSCKTRISWRYPVVEVLSGLIFIFIPLFFIQSGTFLSSLAYGSISLAGIGSFLPLAASWIFAFEVLLLITYIDILLQIVPDELIILLSVAAVLTGIFGGAWLSRAEGAIFGAGFFLLLILITRGKGMGWGDVKLAAPLGFLFGWPNILLLIAIAFVSGAIVGSLLILFSKKTMKSAVPFVPFLSFGSVIAFFFGTGIIFQYFNIIGI